MPKSFFRRAAKNFFIIVNIILAFLFLVGCYGNILNPQYWWPVGFIILSTFYLFCLLLFFIVFWMFAKIRWSLISITAILIAYKPINNILPLNFSAPFALQKPSNALRIMSWNVDNFNVLGYKKHPEIKNNMLNLINEYDPDIACFQEMVAADTLVNLKTPYYRKYSFYPLSGFDSALKFTNNFYSYNVKEDYLSQQHFGVIIFSKYPIINKKTVSYYPYDYNSIFQYADIVKGTDTIRVFNIHLQSLKFSADNLKFLDNPEKQSEQYLAQSKSIIYKLKIGFLKRKLQSERIKTEMDKSPYPVIVCGDFNDVPNSYAYNTIGRGMQNAFTQKGSGLGRTFSGILPTLHIDNIFVSNSFAVQQFTTVPKKLSDHFPIFTDIIFKK